MFQHHCACAALLPHPGLCWPELTQRLGNYSVSVNLRQVTLNCTTIFEKPDPSFCFGVSVETSQELEEHRRTQFSSTFLSERSSQNWPNIRSQYSVALRVFWAQPTEQGCSVQCLLATVAVHVTVHVLFTTLSLSQ